MTLHLLAHDQRRLAAATEALLTIHDGTGPETWWARVEPTLRALFPRANAMLSYADRGRLRFTSSTSDP